MVLGSLPSLALVTYPLGCRGPEPSDKHKCSHCGWRHHVCLHSNYQSPPNIPDPARWEWPTSVEVVQKNFHFSWSPKPLALLAPAWEEHGPLSQVNGSVCNKASRNQRAFSQRALLQSATAFEIWVPSTSSKRKCAHLCGTGPNPIQASRFIFSTLVPKQQKNLTHSQGFGPFLLCNANFYFFPIMQDCKLFKKIH